MSPRFQRRSLQWVSVLVAVLLAALGAAWTYAAHAAGQGPVHLTLAAGFTALCAVAALRATWRLLAGAGDDQPGWLERAGVLEAVDPGLSMLRDDSTPRQDHGGGMWRHLCPYCNAEHKALARRCGSCGQSL